MLSIANLTTSGDAMKYYSADNYYCPTDDLLHQENSSWHGKGAKLLGLSGKVEKEDFTQVLEGKLHDGTQLGRKTKNGIEHDPGIDCTFSAPKSVSIMALVMRDERIVAAHDKAVNMALDYIESHLVGTRATRNGETKWEKVDNVIISKFEEHLSREGDPQLHTHCVVANMVKRADGKYRSAEFGELFPWKITVGTMYRSILAYELQKEGYVIENSHDGTNFEIAGVSKELMDAFSKRSAQIKELIKNYDHNNAKTKADATLKSRKAKRAFVKDLLDKEWNKAIEHDKGNLQTLIDKSKVGDLAREVFADISRIEKQEQYDNASFIGKIAIHTKNALGIIDEVQVGREQKSQEDIAHASISFAMGNLTERDATFVKSELIKSAVHYSMGMLSNPDKSLEVAYLEHIKSRDLIRCKDYYGKGELLTTREMKELELNNIKLMERGQKRVTGLYTEDELTKALGSSSLNKGQKESCKLILTSSDRVVACQGFAGVGKTYMMEETNRLTHAKSYGEMRSHIAELLFREGYEMIGLAPTHEAAGVLETDSGIKSKTLHSFLFKYDGVAEGRGTAMGLENMKDEFKNKIIVVDESSMVSTRQMNALLTIANKLEFRVVLIGDDKQLHGVEAGNPFGQLIEAGMKTAVMNDIRRQNNPDIKTAVYASIKGEIQKAFDKLGDNIIETSQEERDKNAFTLTNDEAGEKIDAKEMMARRAVDLWMASEDKKNTMIISPSNEIRQNINGMVRDHLKSEGVLTGNEHSYRGYYRKDLKQEELRVAKFYAAGDKVIFSNKHLLDKFQFKEGVYYKVDRVRDGLNNKQVVVLIDEKGKERLFHPHSVDKRSSKFVEVYRENDFALQKGDSVKLNRNFNDMKLQNGQHFQVLNVGEKKVSLGVIGKDGSTEKISLDKTHSLLKHMDYAYAITTHGAQGKSIKHVVTVLEADHPSLTNAKMFYVQISRAKDSIYLITDDKEKLAQTLSMHTGERVTALKGIGFQFDKNIADIMNVPKEVEKELAEMSKSITPQEAQKITAKGVKEIKPDPVKSCGTVLNEKEQGELVAEYRREQKEKKQEYKQEKSNQANKEHKSENTRYEYAVDILPRLDVVSLLPEFGFERIHNGYRCTTGLKVDGRYDKDGKNTAHWYDDSRSHIIDPSCNPNNRSVFDLLKEKYMPQAKDSEFLRWLEQLVGLRQEKAVMPKHIKSIVNNKAPAPIKKEKLERPKLDQNVWKAIHEYSKEKLLALHESTKMMQYLQKERGYSKATIDRMGLGYIEDHKMLAHHLNSKGIAKAEVEKTMQILGGVGRYQKLTIPFFNHKNEFLGFTGRDIYYETKGSKKGHKYMNTRGLSKSEMINSQNIDPKKEVTLVEGTLDALHAQAKGIENVIALGGTDFGNKKLSFLREIGVTKINLCLDNDVAGREGAQKIQETLRKDAADISVRETKLPEGVKDLDQMIKERGVERTQALLSSSSDNQLLFKDMDDTSIRANDLVAKTESKEQSKDVEIKGLDVGKDSVKIKEEELEI